MLFEILSPDAPRWAEVFGLLPTAAQDVFYSPGFAQLCQQTIDASHEVLCAAATDANGSVLLYPYVQRKLADIVDMRITNGMKDVVSLYGRGGITGRADADFLAAFHDALGQHMVGNRVLCGFDRLHPVMANERLAVPTCSIRDVGGFVVVDLRPNLDRLESSFKQSVRKDIRKAQRNGVRCFAENNCDHLDDFLDIYYQTMGRNSASEFYYFPKDFFSDLPNRLPGKFHFYYAEHAGKIVSCELVLHCGLYSHSFLGGTLKDALPLAANPLLKLEICVGMKELGVEFFLLGGGLSADDGIFNFKKAYAPNGVYPSRIGGTVWDNAAYAQLRQEMIAAGAPMAANRFQYYDC